MPIEPINLDDHVVKWWKLLVYGPPGVGKSVLACSSQKYRTFVFEIDDDGISSVKAWKVRNKLQTNVKFWKVKSRADFMEAWKWLWAHRREFDLIVVDTETEMQAQFKRETFSANPGDKSLMRNWGQVLDAMDIMTSNMRGAEWHVIVLCHETEKKDEVTEMTIVRPAFQGDWKNQYARHFGVVARYTSWFKNVNENGKIVKKVQRWLDCGPNPTIHYKDRSGVLNRWEPVSIDGLLDKLVSSQLSEEGLAAAMSEGVSTQPEDPSEETTETTEATTETTKENKEKEE